MIIICVDFPLVWLCKDLFWHPPITSSINSSIFRKRVKTLGAMCIHFQFPKINGSCTILWLNSYFRYYVLHASKSFHRIMVIHKPLNTLDLLNIRKLWSKASVLTSNFSSTFGGCNIGKLWGFRKQLRSHY